MSNFHENPYRTWVNLDHFVQEKSQKVNKLTEIAENRVFSITTEIFGP